MNRREFLDILALSPLTKVEAQVSNTCGGTRVFINGVEVQDIMDLRLRHKAGQLPKLYIQLLDMEQTRKKALQVRTESHMRWSDGVVTHKFTVQVHELTIHSKESAGLHAVMETPKTRTKHTISGGTTGPTGCTG